MNRKIYKALWGMSSELSMEENLQRISAAGYDGVECSFPEMEPSEWKDLCAKHSLGYIGNIFAADSESFVRDLGRIRDYDPVLVSSQSGRDKMSFEDGSAFFREALAAEREFGIPVTHETHRHRLFYTPWATAGYLNEFPDLKINADFSHWFVVCESMLNDVKEMLDLACSRAYHIHARVGYEEGPQVPDPRAPEYRRHLERHEELWQKIIAARNAEGAVELTITPEYGPPNYLHTLPHTGVPVADLWEICSWAKDRLLSL